MEHIIRSLLRFGVTLLTTYIGGWVGLLSVALVVTGPAGERMQSDRATETVCGNMFLGPLLLGFSAGLAGGFWVGQRLDRLRWRTGGVSRRV